MLTTIPIIDQEISYGSSHIRHMTYTESQHRIYTYVQVYDPASHTIFERDKLSLFRSASVQEQRITKQHIEDYRPYYHSMHPPAYLVRLITFA